MCDHVFPCGVGGNPSSSEGYMISIRIRGLCQMFRVCVMFGVVVTVRAGFFLQCLLGRFISGCFIPGNLIPGCCLNKCI